MLEIEYRGYVITYPSTRLHSAWWTVNLGSNDRRLFSNLGDRIEIFDDYHSLEGAVTQAKRRVDQLLRDRDTRLTNFSVVHRQEHIDDCVVIVSNHDKERVLAFVSREAIEDYCGRHFNRPHLSYNERIFLLRSDNNLSALALIISEKYQRGEVTLHLASGSTLKRVDIELEDLELGPRLEIAPLIVLDGAGYKR